VSWQSPVCDIGCDSDLRLSGRELGMANMASNFFIPLTILRGTRDMSGECLVPHIRNVIRSQATCFQQTTELILQDLPFYSAVLLQSVA
jgi:hypothetical protein